MTTNREFSLDLAVHSRVMRMMYKPVDRVKRKRLWKTFINKVNGEYEESDLDPFAKEELNGRHVTVIELTDLGREIKIRVAYAQYISKGEGLKTQHIERALRVKDPDSYVAALYS